MARRVLADVMGLDPRTQDGAHEGYLASWRLPTLFYEDDEWTPIPVPPGPMLRLIEMTVAYTDGGWPDPDGTEAAYDRVGWICAGAVRETYLADPRSALLDPFLLWFKVVGSDRWAWLAEGPGSPSMFQWGWGVNCARRLCELAPIANPGLCLIEGVLSPTIGVMAEVADALREGRL